MGRFDWADDGVIDINDTSEEQFIARFKSMTAEQKTAILQDLRDEEEDAEAKAKAVAFLARLGEFTMKGIDLLV